MIINRYILLHDVGGINSLILRTITLHKINQLRAKFNKFLGIIIVIIISIFFEGSFYYDYL